MNRRDFNRCVVVSDITGLPLEECVESFENELSVMREIESRRSMTEEEEAEEEERAERRRR